MKAKLSLAVGLFVLITASCFADNLSVTGTATINELDTTGLIDLQGNSLYFGSFSQSGTSTAALSIIYSDGQSGTNASITLTATRAGSIWNWQRLNTSGSSVGVMQVDAINRLILFGTNGSQGIILDPNSNITINGQPLLTASAANATYLTAATADNRYVNSVNFTVGSVAYSTGGFAPTIALTGGHATGVNSFAGIGATASKDYSNASGPYSYASGNMSNANGFQAYACGDESNAIGWLSTATGWGASAIGYHGQASGYASNAIGWNAKSNGDYSTALGWNSTASGNFSTTTGYQSTASGWGSTASGYQSTATGNVSTAAGANTTAAGFGQFVVGQYNIPQGTLNNWVPTDELFTVGNGTDSTHLSTAFAVKKNGDTTVNGTLTVSGTSGGLVLSGTSIPVTLTSGSTATKVVASGSNQSVLIPEQGDLSMGDFINGAQPLAANSTQMAQQSMQKTVSHQTLQGAGSDSSASYDPLSMKSELESKIISVIDDANAQAAEMAGTSQVSSQTIVAPVVSGPNSTLTTGTAIIQ